MTISTTGNYLGRRSFQDISITLTNDFALVLVFVLSLLSAASGFKCTIEIPVREEV